MHGIEVPSADFLAGAKNLKVKDVTFLVYIEHNLWCNFHGLRDRARTNRNVKCINLFIVRDFHRESISYRHFLCPVNGNDNDTFWFAYYDYFQIPCPKAAIPFFAWVISWPTNIWRQYSGARKRNRDLSLCHFEQCVIAKMDFHMFIIHQLQIQKPSLRMRAEGRFCEEI